MKLVILSSSRADFGIYFDCLKEMEKSKSIDFEVLCFGMHSSKRLGETYKEVESAGFKYKVLEDSIRFGDEPQGLAKAMGETQKMVADYFSEKNVDMILCLGDRFEMFAAVSAVIPFNIPVAHIHGGEQTEGAIDNKFRHALTKLSDLHFATCKKHCDRIIQMGVNPSRVHNVGAPGVAGIKKESFLSIEEFGENFSYDLSKKPMLATYHPVTNDYKNNEKYVEEFLKAIKESKRPVLITLGNVDTYGDRVRERIEEFGKSSDEYHVVKHLGKKGYFTALKHCSMVIGNSSSGIIEAASFKKPVVNIGDRQKGRECSGNTIHSLEDSESILLAIKAAEALDCSKVENIYYNENSSALIVNALENYEQGLDTSFYE